MERVNIIDTFIYNEGADHTRPFIVISLPEQFNWTSDNIAFFKSSGLSNLTPSNDNFFGQLANTWFPTFGVGPMPGKTTTKIYKANDICKLGELKNRDYCPSIHITSLITNFACWIADPKREPEILSQVVYVSRTYLTTRDDNPDNFNYTAMMHRYIGNISKILNNYFTEVWEVFISQRLGGGFWELDEYQLFSLYINSINTIQTPIPLPDFAKMSATFLQKKAERSNNNDGIDNNDNELVNFLLNNNAQIVESKIIPYLRVIVVQGQHFINVCGVELSKLNNRIKSMLSNERIAPSSATDHIGFQSEPSAFIATPGSVSKATKKATNSSSTEENHNNKKKQRIESSSATLSINNTTTNQNITTRPQTRSQTRSQKGGYTKNTNKTRKKIKNCKIKYKLHHTKKSNKNKKNKYNYKKK